MQDERTPATDAEHRLKVIERAATDWGCEGDVAAFINLLALRVQGLEHEVARLKESLQRMVDWTDCQCEDHTSADCCANVPNEHCPGCIAAQALAG